MNVPVHYLLAANIKTKTPCHKDGVFRSLILPGCYLTRSIFRASVNSLPDAVIAVMR